KIEQDELLKGTDRYNVYARRKGIGGSEEEWEEEGEEEKEEGASEEGLRRYVGERLPVYMWLAGGGKLEGMPETRNGKVDRGALPRPEDVKREGGREEEEPRTAYEEIIGGIWEEVLKVEKVSRGENFFEIGGHSLLATQVMARVRKAFGVEVGVRSIFEEGTVEGLGRVVEEKLKGGVKGEGPGLERVRREGRAPLSYGQRRLWFIEQLEAWEGVYNCPAAVRVEGGVGLEALGRGGKEVVRRHEALRTRIEEEGGEPWQVIDEWERYGLEVEDLSGIGEEEREGEMRRRAREEAGRGFDLGRGPLMRVKVLKLGEEEHVL